MARGFVPDVELDASAGTAALTIRGHWEVHVPTHSITSSARASKMGRTASPIALAVFSLLTSGYFLGAWTGRFLGFSPLGMRLT